MNTLNYPLRVSKNKRPFRFSGKKKKMMEQKINEENIENKAFAIKSIPRSVFRNPSHKNKLRLFSISVKF